MIPVEPVPFAHLEGEMTVLAWTDTEGFFKSIGDLVGRTISEVFIDDPEPGCLRLHFLDGGGAVIALSPYVD